MRGNNQKDYESDLKKRIRIRKLPRKDTIREKQAKQDSMTDNVLESRFMTEDSEDKLYDQLFNSDNKRASKTEMSSEHEYKNLIQTYSVFTKEDDLRWRKDTKDSNNFYGTTTKTTQYIETKYSALGRDVGMPFDKDHLIYKRGQSKGDPLQLAIIHANENYRLFKDLKRRSQTPENEYTAFLKFLRLPDISVARDPKYSRTRSKDPYFVYREFKQRFQVQSAKYNAEYEREMELQSEITHSALKRQLAMAKDKEEQEPHKLYKTLNRNFKRSNTEDFFRDPVAACVEVLEYISAWIADLLSLPPPDPVNHDVVIYKREDKNNYSYLTATVKNKKMQFLIAHGVPFNESETFGYMYVNQ